MSSVETVRLPFRKSNFCGEGQPDNHGAPLDASRGPPRQWAARRAGLTATLFSLMKTLGEPQALGFPTPPRLSPPGLPSASALGPPSRPVDTPELFTYRGARSSCIGGMETVVPQGQIGRQSTYENAPLRIQPSVVNLGGTAVV
jgi:hypothetical protein